MTESRRDGTVPTHPLQAVRKRRIINVALTAEGLRLDLIRISLVIGHSLFNISISMETQNHNAHCGAWEGPGIDERVVGGIPGRPERRSPPERP